MRRKNDVICTAVPSFSLDEKAYSDFLLHIEKSVLASLKSKGMLTEKQRRLCAEEIEKQRIIKPNFA